MSEGNSSDSDSQRYILYVLLYSTDTTSVNTGILACHTLFSLSLLYVCISTVNYAIKAKMHHKFVSSSSNVHSSLITYSITRTHTQNHFLPTLYTHIHKNRVHHVCLLLGHLWTATLEVTPALSWLYALGHCCCC